MTPARATDQNPPMTNPIPQAFADGAAAPHEAAADRVRCAEDVAATVHARLRSTAAAAIRCEAADAGDREAAAAWATEAAIVLEAVAAMLAPAAAAPAEASGIGTREK